MFFLNFFYISNVSIYEGPKKDALNKMLQPFANEEEIPPPPQVPAPPVPNNMEEGMEDMDDGNLN